MHGDKIASVGNRQSKVWVGVLRGSLAVMLLVALPRTVRADTVPPGPPSYGSYCLLDRSPFLVESQLPESLQCQFDRDGNGLDDEIERQLAHCFAPELHFDSAENALEDDEPSLLFSAYRSEDPSEQERQIVLRMTALWHKDGGFALDGGIGCGDDHAGDAQPISVTVAVVEGLSAWMAYPISFAASDEPQTYHQTHPLIYPSAGKHHWYNTTVDTTYTTHGGPFSFDCEDRADGSGKVRIPGQNGIALARPGAAGHHRVPRRARTRQLRRLLDHPHGGLLRGWIRQRLQVGSWRS
jgi:hypothetical protein